MELNEALAFIHATDWKGSRLGLERMRELMHRLGNPQDSLKFIHVAGTNGKGSTSTMLASILTAAGYKTGLYTSPHLVRVNERFRHHGLGHPRRGTLPRRRSREGGRRRHVRRAHGV